jgi:hypothetical protein
LHKCDFYESKKAGNKLKYQHFFFILLLFFFRKFIKNKRKYLFINRKMLELGASKHWKEALETLTGERTINANALFEYFEPLTKWLLKENKKDFLNIIS